MILALLLGVGLSFLAAAYLALFGDAASPRLLLFYLLASSGVLVLAHQRPAWSVRLKWGWAALSLLVIFVIFRSMIDDLAMI